MTGTVITVTQQKGGAGKTTLAAQLAVTLLRDGASVATIDIDPQGSLSLWYAARMAALGAGNRLVHSQVQGWSLKKEAERLAADHDYVIIDSPPHAESESAIAIRAADLVLIPVQPSPLDLWACRPTVQVIQKEGRRALFVMNRVPPRARLTDAMEEKLALLEIPATRQTLGNRVAFAASIAEGKGVVETEPSGPAAQEIRAVVKEIQRAADAARKAA